MKRLAPVLLVVAFASCSAREPISKDPSTRTTPLPAPLSQLGEPCHAETEDVHCGTDGRVAMLVVHQPIDMPPGTLLGGNVEQPVSLAIEDGRVWVHWQCQLCRVMRIDYAVADLSRVKEASLARLQAWAGLPASPLLRTEADWRTATRDWKPAG